MSRGSRVAGLIGVMLIVVYAVWEFGMSHDWFTALAVGSILHCLGALFAVTMLFRAYKLSGGKKYWLYYGLGAICYGAAHTYLTIELLVTLEVPGAFGPAQVLWIVQYGWIMMALFHQGRNKQESVIPYMVDLLLFLSVTITVYWQLFLRPAIGEESVSGAMMVLYLFCPSANLVVLISLLILFAFERTQVTRTTTLLLGFAFLAKTVGNSLFLFLDGAMDPSTVEFALADYCWFTGVMFLGFAAVFGRQAEDTPILADIKHSGLKRHIPLAVGGFLLLFLHAASHPFSPVTVGSLVGVSLLTVRLFAGIRHSESVNRALRESNFTYRNWAESALVGVFIEQDGRLAYVNSYCETLFGYQPGKMIGQTIVSHIAFADVPLFLAQAEKLKGNVPTTRFGVTGVKRDQTNLYLEMHLATTYYRGRIALSGTLIDITERKMSEQYLIRSEKLSVVGQLAAGVAHEIRNPLTALKGFTQLLHQNSDDNRKYYEIMLTELERINYIVGEFMVLSKPHNRQQLKEHDIHRILTTIIPILESQAILHNVIIRVESSPDLPKVKCDENQIKQVFINLMKNAIEAMPEGGTVTIRYETDFPKRELIVYIEDQGDGIPPELLARLGEPFLTTKEKGTGLGLMVCYKIIQAHEGMMSVNSQPGQGTSVKIVLPAR